MSGEKTEQPTPKKLREARKKGQVAHSKEVSSTALLIAIFALLWIFWADTLPRLQQMIVLPGQYYDVPFDQAWRAVSAGILEGAVKISLPILAVTIVVAIASNYVQIGALLAFESIKPDLKKLNPIDGAKKIFSKKNLFEFLKSSFKVTFLSVLLYIVIKDAIPALILAPYSGRTGVLVLLGETMWNILLYTGFAYVVIAAADWFMQKRMHNKELMMSKEEVKQEYKEMEGDPHIKQKRKQLHKEMVMGDTVEKTRKASVVVTNPTHLAVAIFYDKDKTPLPMVTAKGQDHVARRMIEVAQEEGIPIMRNVSLAHDLYDHGDVDQYIPSELIVPVAEVLRFVQEMKEGGT